MSTELAELLDRAYDTRDPIDPISTTHPSLDIDAAYEVQRAVVARWAERGKRVVGRKIGLTAAAMQRQLGVDQPDFGVITDDMLIGSGESVPVARFIAPRVEPELAFVFGDVVEGPSVRPADVVAAVRSIAPALEIIDSRVRDWRIGIVDTIADNASSGAVVVGEPVALDGIDLRGMGCILRRDGEIAATGAGGAVLGSPLRALAWLVRTLSRFGESLQPGDVVIPGSMTAAQPVRAGELWTAQLGGVGTVSVRFTGEENR